MASVFVVMYLSKPLKAFSTYKAADLFRLSESLRQADKECPAWHNAKIVEIELDSEIGAALHRRYAGWVIRCKLNGPGGEVCCEVLRDSILLGADEEPVYRKFEVDRPFHLFPVQAAISADAYYSSDGLTESEALALAAIDAKEAIYAQTYTVVGNGPDGPVDRVFEDEGVARAFIESEPIAKAQLKIGPEYMWDKYKHGWGVKTCETIYYVN